jgi:hypothetical protein
MESCVDEQQVHYYFGTALRPTTSLPSSTILPPIMNESHTQMMCCSPIELDHQKMELTKATRHQTQEQSSLLPSPSFMNSSAVIVTY